MLGQTLTKREQVLVDKGRGENVLVLRQEYQEALRGESSDKIAELTGRNVVGMMSANHLTPTSLPRSTSSTGHRTHPGHRRPVSRFSGPHRR